MRTTEEQREARLDVIAAARMMIEGASTEAVESFLGGSDAPPVELAKAATAFTGSLLVMMPRDRATMILDGLRQAAIEE